MSADERKYYSYLCTSPNGATLDVDEEVWRRMHRWSPHRLRHNAGTFIAGEFGIELARVILGHRHIRTTELYAEADTKKALAAIKRIG